MTNVNATLTLFNRGRKIEMPIFDFNVYVSERMRNVQIVHSSPAGVATIESYVNTRNGAVMQKRRFVSPSTFYLMYRHRLPHVQLA